MRAKSLHLCPTLHNTTDCTRQAALSMGFPRQEYWSGLPFPPPEDHPNSGIEPTYPALAGRFFTTSATWEVLSRALLVGYYLKKKKKERK